MSDLPTPITREERYLNGIAQGDTSDLPTPVSREEQYLDFIAKSGGGGSGDGDMKKSVYDSDLAVANAGGIKSFVSNAVSGKVDKVEGKGLSTNDYSDTEKGKVADNTSAIEATQDMISDAYNSTATYAVGDYCIYENVLYKCNTAIATPEAFTPAKWDATNVANELIKIKSVALSGTLDADGNIEIPSLTQNDYPIAYLGDIGSADIVVFWDGSGAAGYQHYCHFLRLSSVAVSGAVIYLSRDIV